MRRFISFLLFLLIVFLPVLSLATDYSSMTDEELQIALKEIQAEIDKRNSERDITIILAEDDCIKAEFLGFVDMPELQLFHVSIKVYNKTEKNLMISLQDGSVNNMSMLMIMSGVPLVVQPNKEGQNAFIFTYKQAGISSFDEVKQVAFKIIAYDDNMKEIDKTKEAVIER